MIKSSDRGQQNILITGVNGFVGRALAHQLAEQKNKLVRGVRRLDGIACPEHYTVVGDINSVTEWSGIVRGVDVVVHLAARVHVMPGFSPVSLQDYRECNVEGTLNLARQAAACKVQRFIYLSSIKVNGEETFGQPFSADDIPAPVEPYALSKHEAELGLLKLARETGLEVVIIRPPLVYGPAVKANFYRMMHWLAKGIPLPLGAIHNKRSLVALGNLVDLIITCIDHPAAANQIFLAGDGEDLSTTELLRKLGRALGKPARLFPVPPLLLAFALKLSAKGDMGKRLCGSLRVDTDKTKDLLGWHPPVSVDEGLRVTAEWYLQQQRGCCFPET